MPNDFYYDDDRRSLPIDEAYPVGSVWRHRSLPDTDITVLGNDGYRVQVDWDGNDETLNSDWLRGALDLASTILVSLPDNPAKEAPMTTTYDPNRPYVIGDRVQVTDVRTRVGSGELGSGESPFVGKTATIESDRYHDSYVLKFDDEGIDGFGTWSHAALDLIVDDEVEVSDEIKVGDTVRVVEATYGSYGIGKTGVVTSVTGTWRPEFHPDDVHPYEVDLGEPLGILHCSKVEKVGSEKVASTDDGLDPDNLTGMDLGENDEVPGPTDTNPNRDLAVGDRVRFRKTSWKSGSESIDVGRMHGIVAGDEGVITATADYVDEGGDVTNYDVDWDKEGSRPANSIHMSWLDPIDTDPAAIAEAMIRRLEAEAARRSDEVAAKQRDLDAARVMLSEQRDEIDTLRNERSTLTQAASDERRRLVDEIDSLKAEIGENHRQAVAEGARLQSALDYAYDMLPQSKQVQVDGFIDGFAKAQA